MTEIGAPDLRFTHEEAADFLGRTMGLNLTAERVGALEKGTEGWIAGLQLAAHALKDREQEFSSMEALAGARATSSTTWPTRSSPASRRTFGISC